MLAQARFPQVSLSYELLDLSTYPWLVFHLLISVPNHEFIISTIEFLALWGPKKGPPVLQR